MTPKQKLLKNRLLSFLDRLIAHVEELKDAGIPTNMDALLKQQRQRVSAADTPTVLLQVSESDVVSRYLKRIDDLEDSVSDFDDIDEHDSQALERKSASFDSWLEDVSIELDKLRDSVQAECGDMATAGATESMLMLSSALRAQGATTALVVAFKRKSLTELIAQRKLQRRWRKTPEGKRSLQKAKRRAMRPHLIDKKRSKAQKLARQAYSHY